MTDQKFVFNPNDEMFKDVDPKFLKELAESDLPEDLKQDLAETEAGIGLSKVYDDIDEWWSDLINASDPEPDAV